MGVSKSEVLRLACDVLVIGGGGAGMYAAIAAAEAGSEVLLVDQNLVARGGATVMAQMTVAAALAEEEPDDWEIHLDDTLKAGRGLCVPELAALLCREAPDRIREMDSWKVGWARRDGRIRQVMAPGHSRKRCCYVDVLNTGPAVAGALHKRVARISGIRRVSNLMVTEILRDAEGAKGAFGFLVADATPVAIEAGAVVIAAGGITRIFRRNSASATMAGHSYALALRAGAELVDMEFVQFFPIGHLAPRMVGMDPIMWDPFRYKLGGRLLNGLGEEFIERYGAADAGQYRAPRDVTTYAIWKEVEAGRGTPAGGAYLSFQHVPEADLREAFGPVIDRLARNGIDLRRMPVEVSPIAHYHMGGIRVDTSMASGIPGLYAAGEAVGGANGANRLSGNAIPEALVFGHVAGREAARHARPGRRALASDDFAAALNRFDDRLSDREAADPRALGRIEETLAETMWTRVGPFRTETGLRQALAEIDALAAELDTLSAGAQRAYNARLMTWFDLSAALLAARSVALAALARRESRGAHQREDYPQTDDAQAFNQRVRLADGALMLAS